MLNVFKRKSALTPYQLAVKEKRLMNMQIKPYAEFNRGMRISCPIWMTPGAFKEFITSPHEKIDRRADIGLWWAQVLTSFHRIPPKEDLMELVYDVEVFYLYGYRQFKTIKLMSVGTEQDHGLLFMLPNEEPPLPV